MSRSKYHLQTDRTGNWYVDVPVDHGSVSVRVSFARRYHDPPVRDDGSVDIELLANELQEEVKGGTLQIHNVFEHEGMKFPVQIELGSRDELETLIRVIRKVFREGLKRSNQVRQGGLDLCRERLAEAGAAEEPEDGDRRRGDRRDIGDRRAAERRQWYSPPAKDLRKDERRNGGERRNGSERRVA